LFLRVDAKAVVVAQRHHEFSEFVVNNAGGALAIDVSVADWRSGRDNPSSLLRR
jgi:hypothetical protein